MAFPSSQPPRLPHVGVPTVLWLLFSFDGRIGREPFWLGFAFVSLVETILLSPFRGDIETLITTPDPLFLAILALGLWTEFALAIKRLHDRGLGAIFSLLLLVPLANIIFFFIFLGFTPGEPGANRYGPAQNARGPRRR